MIVINGDKDEHTEMLQGGVIRQLLDEKWKTFVRVKYNRCSKITIPLALYRQLGSIVNRY